MVGPVFPTTTHDRTYANAYRSRFAGTILYDASFALAKNPAIVEQMLRDPIIKQAVGDTCAAIADSTWQVQPYSQRPDDVAWAAHLQELAQCCEIGFVKTIRMLARAYFTGEEWADPRWRIVSEQLADDDQERRYAVVRSMKHVDRRRLMRRIVREEGKEPRIAWFLSAVFHAGEWANYSELDGKDGRKSRSDLIRHTADEPESALGRGDGVIEASYWFYYAKQIVMREGLQGLERWAQGWVIFKQDAKADAAPDDDNEALMAEAITEIETHTGRRILGIDSRDEIDVNPGPQNEKMIEFWVNYLDQGQTRLLTGSLLPTGGGADVGSEARGRVEQDTSDRFLQGKQTDLAETLTHQFLRPLHDANSSARHAMGLGNARCGRWSFTQDVVEDPTRNTANAVALIQAGVELVAADVYDKTGFKEPAEGDQILVVKPPAPAFDPFAGGSPDGAA